MITGHRVELDEAHRLPDVRGGVPLAAPYGGPDDTSPYLGKRRPEGYEYQTTAWTVTARKPFRCQDRGDRAVVPGQQYVRTVAFPGHDAVGSDRPWVLKVCTSCATRFGRALPPTRRGRR